MFICGWLQQNSIPELLQNATVPSTYPGPRRLVARGLIISRVPGLHSARHDRLQFGGRHVIAAPLGIAQSNMIDNPHRKTLSHYYTTTLAGRLCLCVGWPFLTTWAQASGPTLTLLGRPLLEAPAIYLGITSKHRSWGRHPSQ